MNLVGEVGQSVGHHTSEGDYFGEGGSRGVEGIK